MTPFVKASVPESEIKIAIAGVVKAWQRKDPAVLASIPEAATEEEVIILASNICRDEQRNARVYLNDTYQVHLRNASDDGRITHLSIKRIDREAIHDWRDLQQIKNELVGPECEAVELYPAESRRVDGANQYHLFCVTDPTYRFPFGFTTRAVSDGPIGKSKNRKL